MRSWLLSMAIFDTKYLMYKFDIYLPMKENFQDGIGKR